MELEGNVLEDPGGDVLHLQRHRRIRRAGLIIAAVEVVHHLPAHHQRLHPARLHFVLLQRGDVLAVPQDGDAVADLDQLVYIMGDENDRLARLPQLADQTIEDVPPLLGQCRGGLVHDEQFRHLIKGPGDLHQLAVLEGEGPRQRVGDMLVPTTSSSSFCASWVRRLLSRMPNRQYWSSRPAQILAATDTVSMVPCSCTIILTPCWLASKLSAGRYGSPKRNISPSSAFRFPEMIAERVDFPEPFSPISPCTSPG